MHDEYSTVDSVRLHWDVRKLVVPLLQVERGAVGEEVSVLQIVQDILDYLVPVARQAVVEPDCPFLHTNGNKSPVLLLVEVDGDEDGMSGGVEDFIDGGSIYWPTENAVKATLEQFGVEVGVQHNDFPASVGRAKFDQRKVEIEDSVIDQTIFSQSCYVIQPDAHITELGHDLVGVVTTTDVADVLGLLWTEEDSLGFR